MKYERDDKGFWKPNNKPTNETNHWTFVELNRECMWDTGVFVYIL